MRGRIDGKLAMSSTTQSPQIDSSATWPHIRGGQHRIPGAGFGNRDEGYEGQRRDIADARCGPPREVSRNISAHWATKHNSAIVATERPTMTLESQESTHAKARRHRRPGKWSETRSRIHRRRITAAASAALRVRLRGRIPADRRCKGERRTTRSDTLNAATAQRKYHHVMTLTGTILS